MKGIFGPYVLWPFDKKLIFDRSLVEAVQGIALSGDFCVPFLKFETFSAGLFQRQFCKKKRIFSSCSKIHATRCPMIGLNKDIQKPSIDTKVIRHKSCNAMGYLYLVEQDTNEYVSVGYLKFIIRLPRKRCFFALKYPKVASSNTFCLEAHAGFFILLTLDSGISVAPWNGTFGKNNKRSPLKKHIPLHQITEFRTIFMDYSLE